MKPRKESSNGEKFNLSYPFCGFMSYGEELWMGDKFHYLDNQRAPFQLIWLLEYPHGAFFSLPNEMGISMPLGSETNPTIRNHPQVLCIR